jgi:hypothetical protein
VRLICLFASVGDPGSGLGLGLVGGGAFVGDVFDGLCILYIELIC